MRAFAYSRFSHEDSTDQSIEGQMLSQDKYAERAGIEIVQRFSDHAISGASILNRPKLTQLLQLIENAEIDVVLVDHLDRLTRDDGDMAYIHKLLDFNRIELHSVAHNGRVDRNISSIMAMVGRNQLESTAHAVRRGQALRFKEGKNPGSRPYGYRLTGVPGELEIDNGDDTRIGEADIVRRIYGERLSGLTPRSIAGRLNDEGIPPPRGERWNASTLNGSKARQTGILRNPIYMGVKQWNRLTMKRNPTTGKRISRTNQAEDIQTLSLPQLAIVDAATFRRVQEMFPQTEKDHPSNYRRAKTLFSGLMKCGCCGGGMSMKDKSKGRIRIQCSTMKESRSCSNTRAFYLDEITEAALDGLAEKLSAPAAMEQLVKSYNSERARLAADVIEKRKVIDKQLGLLKVKEDKLWSDYDSGILDGRIANDRIMNVKREMDELEVKKASIPPAPETITLHPGSMARFLTHVEQLSKLYAVQIDEDNREAAEAIRRLINKITVTPTEAGTDIKIDGLLGLLVDQPQFSSSVGGLMVAEEGFEPPTQGL